jgi:hypothetical protein
MAIFKNVFFKDVAAATDTDLLHQPSVQDWKIVALTALTAHWVSVTKIILFHPKRSSKKVIHQRQTDTHTHMFVIIYRIPQSWHFEQ